MPYLPDSYKVRSGPGVSCVRIQVSKAPDLHMKHQRNGFDFIYLDRIYRIDGIFFAFGEEPFRPKAVLSR